MALVACTFCRRIFTPRGEGRVCPNCRRRLDELYVDVRNYLRDNPDEDFNVERVSGALGADVRDVQGLVDEGYIDIDLKGEDEDIKAVLESGLESEIESSMERRRLSREFERSLDRMKMKAEAEAARHRTVSYGQDIYGGKTKRQRFF